MHLFGPVAVRILQRPGVWNLTPHAQALGVGMAEARHAIVGKTAIEIGVGTGVHAIAALRLGARAIDVTDIESAALEAAAQNAELNGVSYRGAWLQDWMDSSPPEPYDLVLCNPPFCKAGTPDRRYFIQQLIARSPVFLRPGGHLLFVQSSMADFAQTERELSGAGFYFTAVHESRGLFREYYFDEPGFLEEISSVDGGYETIDGAYVETLRVYLGTKR